MVLRKLCIQQANGLQCVCCISIHTNIYATHLDTRGDICCCVKIPNLSTNSINVYINSNVQSLLITNNDTEA